MLTLYYLSFQYKRGVGLISITYKKKNNNKNRNDNNSKLSLLHPFCFQVKFVVHQQTFSTLVALQHCCFYKQPKPELLFCTSLFSMYIKSLFMAQYIPNSSPLMIHHQFYL